MVSRSPRYIRATQRSTLTIPVRGSWVWLLKLAMRYDPLQKFALLTCKSCTQSSICGYDSILVRDINYLNCASPPAGSVSTKQQRDKYRQKLLAAFEPHYHPDHCVPSEFKEAFPAGRFRPVCKIQAKRGAASTAVADMIKPPEWWHSTRIIQAFDSVLQDKVSS